MAPTWRTVRVFISSTFRDMHAERNHLVRFVFPELKERCHRRLVHLLDVDLRWGVTEQDVQDGKALDICLDVVDTCRPYFLGLLGHRYGWIPPGEQHSITAQEIYHGVLHDDLPRQVLDLRRLLEEKLDGRPFSEEEKNCLARAYPWDGEKGKHRLRPDLPPEDLELLRAVFGRIAAYQRDRSFFWLRQESLTRELAGENLEDFFEAKPEDQAKLAALKEEIKAAGLPCFEYDDLETFGHQVLETLWARIEAELAAAPAPEVKGWLEEEAELHELFLTERARRFVGRQEFLDRLHAFCPTADEPAVLVVTGEPGVGKSALLARFTQEARQRHPDWLILPHFVGASPGSTLIRQTLKRFCLHIYKTCDLENQKQERLRQVSGDEEQARQERETIEKEYRISDDYLELAAAFPQFLEKAASTHRVLIILDALNQLDRADNAQALRWLPHNLPPNVCVVLSALPGEALEALRARRLKPREETVTGLTPAEIRAMITGYLQEIRREFPNPRVEEDFFAKVQAGSPLYIQVALEELRIFPVFEQLPQRVAELPAGVPALFDQVLERLEGDFRAYPGLVRDCLTFLACGRFGLTQEELQSLLKGYAPRSDTQEEPEKLPDMVWARLYRSCSAYLFSRAGVIDFFHGQLQDAVERRYLPEEPTRLKAHETIAAYFEARWREPYARALSELPYHLMSAQQREELRQLLWDFTWIQTKLQVFEVPALIQDYDYLAEDADLRLVQAALRLSAHVLADDENQLAGQLTGRLLTQESPEIKEFLTRIREEQTGLWLRPLTPTLAQAGGPLLRTFSGHVDMVNAVAVWPEQGWAVSASHDHTLKVWNLRTGEAIRTLTGHTDAVTAVAVWPEQGWAVSASRDRTLKVWDLRTGELIRTLTGHEDSVLVVALWPEQGWAVSASFGTTLKVWDLRTGELIRTLTGHEDSVLAVALWPEQGWAVSASFDETLKVWDLGTGELIRTFTGHDDTVTAVALWPEQGWAVSVSRDKTLQVWDLRTGELIRTLTGHSNWVEALAVWPERGWALSNLDGDTLKVWDLGTGELIRTFTGHNDTVTAVALWLEQGWAVSASRDRTLKVWDLRAGETIPIPTSHTDGVNAVTVWTEQGWAISASGDKTIKVWDLGTGELIRTLTGHDNTVTAVALWPEQGWAVSASRRTLMVLDLLTGEDIRPFNSQTTILTMLLWLLKYRPLTGHTWDVNSVAVWAEKGWAVSASEDRTLKVWDLRTRKLIRTLTGHTKSVTAVALWPEQGWAVSASQDKTLKVWDLRTGELIRTLTGHTKSVTAVALWPERGWAVSASEDRTLKVWDLGTGDVLVTFTGERHLWCCATAPADSTLVAGGKSGEMHLLRLEGLEGATEGPPRVTARRLPKPPWWRVWPRKQETPLGLCCPRCRQWSQVPEAALGREFPCPQCSQTIKLNPFALEADWRPLAQARQGK
ncbi:MAG: AAA family ATPase [Thermodesulfobacteriota bacterium]